MLSGVPQGSVLGPLLFLIFINDIDEGIINRLLKFADDAKLMGKVSNVQMIQSMRNDLDLLFDWSNKWGMEFNVKKCKVMHIGNNNPNVVYEINGNSLDIVQKEKDLGVIVSNNLKVSDQCAAAVKTANRVLGLIRRTFMCRGKDIILRLYKSLVRPHLEYCMHVCMEAPFAEGC